jgi:integrase
MMATSKREAGLRKTAQRLGITPLAPRSWSNTIAPLNRFLRICSMLQEEAHQLAEFRGKLNLQELQASGVDYKPLIDAVDGCSLLSRAEVKHIKQASFLGAVIRFRGSELSRPRGVSAPKIKKAQRDTEVFDFPMAEFPKLLSAATSWRDKALWLLTAASGIRRSEALNVEWHHIDFDKQTVYVLDPEYTRYGKDLADEERHRRFKGRAVSWTYLRSPYRQWFFEALLEYRKREYVLPADGNDYVFQYVTHAHRGVPYRQASDQTLNKSFTSAVVRAAIQGPPMNPEYVWTQRSLRHAYGVFLLNDMAIPGQELPGLSARSGELELPSPTLLVVDESSMPYLSAMYRILPDGFRLLLVGDPAQLPPIGFGLVFHRLVGENDVPRTHLNQVHRQAEATGIPSAASAIRGHMVPTIASFTGQSVGVSFLECQSEHVLPNLLRLGAPGLLTSVRLC